MNKTHRYQKKELRLIVACWFVLLGFTSCSSTRSKQSQQSVDKPAVELGDAQQDKAPQLDAKTYYDQSYGADEAAGDTLGDSDSNQAMGLKTVFFRFDAFDLDEPSKLTIAQNAHIMQEHPGMTVQIEGHCDQRGGIQYNLALGEKRANTVRSALVRAGVAESRISIISYGKEKLLDEGLTEEAHAKNRRGNFVLLSK